MNKEHPHKKVIMQMDSVASLISLLDDSRESYLKKNLSTHLHGRELALIKQIYKHTKPHHKKVRIQRYQKLQENPELIPENYEVHKKIFISRYKKLEKKGLIKLDLEVDNGLPYDMEFTQKGIDLLNEITKLEKEWEDEVLKDFEDKDKLVDLLQSITLDALEVKYKIEKESKGIY